MEDANHLIGLEHLLGAVLVGDRRPIMGLRPRNGAQRTARWNREAPAKKLVGIP
jgi:hypothetical protein